MKFKSLKLAASVAAMALCSLPLSASASLIYSSALTTSAQGFGTAPRLLTLQGDSGTNQNPTGVESGGVGVSSTGQIIVGGAGSVIADSSVHDFNGVSNSSSVNSLVQPTTDNQKYGIVTSGLLGITSASQIGILFNATEPSGDSINVIDLTLKFYSSTGTFLGAIDGSQNFLNSNPGNGVAGFTFVVDSAEQSYVNGLLAMGGAGTTFALEASLTDFAGGAESFLVYNVGTGAPPPPRPGNSVPEPGTLALLGLGMMGAAIARRKSKA